MKCEKPNRTVSPCALVLGVIPDESKRTIRNPSVQEVTFPSREKSEVGLLFADAEFFTHAIQVAPIHL